VAAVATRPGLVRAARAARAGCASDRDCPALAAFTQSHLPVTAAVGLLVLLTPALIGAFWGAPLIAREYEAGTQRLVWAQGIGRPYWLAAELAVVGGAAVAAAGLLSALVTWWARPLDDAAGSVYDTFAQRDLAPVGYALFACALGVVAGLVIRRTLPAMAVTLAGLIAVRMVVTDWIRPLAGTPRQLAIPLDPDHTGYGSGGNILFGIGPSTLDPPSPDLPDAWIRSDRIVDAAGHPLTTQALHAACPTIDQRDAGGVVGGHGPVPEAARRTLHDCVGTVGASYHELVVYHPGSRYWLFQWWEFAVYLALAALLCGYAWVRLRRRA
jgi:hypothetical protein